MSDDRIRTLTESLIGIVTSLGAVNTRSEDTSIKEGHELVLELMHLLGYENAARIVRKELTGDFVNQGSLDERKVVINGVSGLTVVSESDNLKTASKWLNSIWDFILKNRRNPKLLQKVEEIIEKSRPLTPIVITDEGDRIREYPVSHDITFPRHTRDSDEFKHHLGIHDLCTGRIELMPASKDFNLLHCGRCHLRVYVPQKVRTYDKLRLYFNHLQVSDE